MPLIILKKQFISAFFILGLIIGPLYSISLYWQYSNTSLRYNNQYYEASSNSRFLLLNNSYLGSITTRSIQIVDHSVYALVKPSQHVTQYPFQNFANNGSFELLELNLSTNFESILSSKTYLIPQLSVNDNYSVVYSYSRVFFDGSKFWFFIVPPYQSTKPYYFFLSSFTKQGTILSNNTLFLPSNHTTDFQPIIKLLGFYEDYFFISDLGSSTLLVYSGLDFFLAFSLSLDSLPEGPYIGFGNVDEQGLLWLQKSEQGSHKEAQFVAFSLQQLLDTRLVTGKKIINFLHSTSYVIHNETFNGIPIKNDLQSNFVTTSTHLFSLQYSAIDDSNYVLEGLYVIAVSHVSLPFNDIVITFLGNLLCFSTGISLLYFKYRSKTKFNSK